MARKNGPPIPEEAEAAGVIEAEKPKLPLTQRLAEAIKKRTEESGDGLVVVSNRTGTSHALLRTVDNGVEAVWLESLHPKINWSSRDYYGLLLTGFILIPVNGNSTGMAFNVDRGLMPQVRRDFAATGGFDYNNHQGAVIEDPARPTAFICMSGLSAGFHEVPLNTVTLLAENGHVNPDLTQRALEASRRQASVSPISE